MSSAVARWREQLEAWALPPQLLASVSESPYGWPESLWRRRAQSAVDRGEVTPTTERVIELGGPGGSVLDVGAGTGRASLPLARAGHPVTAVERSLSMLSGLRDLAAGLPVEVVEGSWPEGAQLVGDHDVAICAHVVYDVADIGPFVKTLDEKAEGGVAIELTETHPWTHLGPFYRALHDLDRPSGPSANDFAQVVEEVLGITPNLDRWSRPPDLWFESSGEILELYGRRLLVAPERWPDLEALLAPEIIEVDGRFQFGTEPRRFVTAWWRK